MCIPIKAWSIECISALTSSLGKPMKMDDMTAKMCQSGVRRTDYARVLVEFEAKKVMKNEIKIKYIDNGKKCKSRRRTKEEIKAKFEAEEKLKKDNEEKAKKEFLERHNKNRNWNQQKKNGQIKVTDIDKNIEKGK
ncbi:hypothetical protein Tco_1391948 [Tanacetum coccineum]